MKTPGGEGGLAGAMRVWLAAGVAALVAVGGGGTYTLLRPGSGRVEVVVRRGQSAASVAAELRRAGVISSSFPFRVVARLRGLDARLQAGRYRLRRGMGAAAAVAALAAGPVEQSVRLSVPEGYTLRQIAQRVARRTHITEADFLAAASSGGVRAAIQPPEVSSLEGFLFPETYAVSETETAPQLVARMVRTFEQRTASLDWQAAAPRGLTPYQVLIVASLVEREAKVAEDRAKVAAVIYNRLARGMRLQVDATVLYELPAHKVPTRRDLQRPSPYNTYLHPGLPPTPIANPGLAALEAALHPAPIDALYYVVVDPSGRHAFTADPKEFERLKRLRPPAVRGGE